MPSEVPKRRIVHAAILALGLAGALVACNALSGLSDFHEVSCDDAAILCNLDGSAGDDASADVTPSDAPQNDDVALVDAGPLNPHRVWAHWPMPNPADAGLPHPARYDDAGSATVVDLVTSLEWERTPSKFDVFNEAQRYCAQTTLGGKSGWRLPTRVELVSLINTTKSDPAMESPPFLKGVPGAGTQRTWTESPVSGKKGTYWVVDFLNGAVVNDQSAANKAVARCVRGGAP